MSDLVNKSAFEGLSDDELLRRQQREADDFEQHECDGTGGCYIWLDEILAMEDELQKRGVQYA